MYVCVFIYKNNNLFNIIKDFNLYIAIIKDNIYIIVKYIIFSNFFNILLILKIKNKNKINSKKFSIGINFFY